MKSLQHIAIIMDGNGRWAKIKNRPRTFGHIKGARVAKKIITHAAKLGLKNLTLYAFSTENWLRPKEEVTFLMTLLQRYLEKETTNLIKENIKFTTIGDHSKLPVEIRQKIETATARTENCTGLHLCFAISYGSRQEVTLAMKQIAEDIQAGKIAATDVTEELINSKMMTAGSVDPDLIIRTSGESRLSNFLLWQASYSELYFTQTLWPDFTTVAFDNACLNYLERCRRFGQVDHANAAEPAPNNNNLIGSGNEELHF